VVGPDALAKKQHSYQAKPKPSQLSFQGEHSFEV